MRAVSITLKERVSQHFLVLDTNSVNDLKKICLYPYIRVKLDLRNAYLRDNMYPNATPLKTILEPIRMKLTDLKLNLRQYGDNSTIIDLPHLQKLEEISVGTLCLRKNVDNSLEINSLRGPGCETILKSPKLEEVNITCRKVQVLQLEGLSNTLKKVMVSKCTDFTGLPKLFAAVGQSLTHLEFYNCDNKIIPSLIGSNIKLPVLESLSFHEHDTSTSTPGL